MAKKRMETNMPYDKAKRNATISRYQKKSTTRFNLLFHNVTDAELIGFIKAEKERGKSPTQVVRDLYKKGK